MNLITRRFSAAQRPMQKQSCRPDRSIFSFPARIFKCNATLQTTSRDVRGAGRRMVVVNSQSGGAPQGQVNSALMSSMEASIAEALEAKKVKVSDVYGDGRHVTIEVVSEQFEGKSQMQRQRMVYKAIWLELQEAVHAVDSMITATPSEV